ncbi:hypothetical protein PV760_13665 [Paenarthrobacter sp. CC6]|uniref:hypothetical protein n=1 Tax=Paenarthrobacter sp. CC6 TaxID=3029184 RepID=UPI00339CB610
MPVANPVVTVFLIPENDRLAALGRILDPNQKFGPGLRVASGLVVIYGFRSH